MSKFTRYCSNALLILAFAFLCQCDQPYGWEDPYEEDQWTLFTKAGGLSSNQIMSLEADSRGNLWVGSWDNGLMKYDGNNWTFYDEQDGLPDFTIYTIEEDLNGDILLGTFYGLSIFNGSRFDNYLFGEEYLPIIDIHVASNGNIWMATAGYGLLELGNQLNQYILYNQPQSVIVFSITEDLNHVIWAGTAGGVFKISGSRVDFLDRGNGLPRDTVTAVYADSWGDVWMGIWGAEHVYRYDEDGLEGIDLYNGFPGVGVNCILEDSRGNLWFALKQAGVVKYDGAVMKTYLDVDGLPSNSINCIEEDQEGNLWFGSDAHGLSRLRSGNR